MHQGGPRLPGLEDCRALGELRWEGQVPLWICSNWPVPLFPSTTLPAPLLQTHHTPAALLFATQHIILVTPFPRLATVFLHIGPIILWPFISSLVPFSLPITCLVPKHILWRCRFCCVTLGEPRPQPMCTLLLNLCRRWAALAGNPTVIVSRLGDPDHKAGLARHEMAFPCCSASDQTCRGETHLDKVHKRPWEQRVQVTDVLRKPVEDSSWETTQHKSAD